MLPLPRRSLCGNKVNDRGYMNELLYWIWLSLCSRPDSATFPSLLKKFKTAKEVYDATDSEISSALTPRSSDRNLLLKRDLERPRKILEFCEKHGVGILTYGDDMYPESLRNIQTPPVLLYYRGELPDFNSGVRIAIVGTRKLTDTGRKNAFHLAYDLAKSGATVVSGMAIGIDGVAHAGALAANMPTVAVIGSGIDVCYPKAHLKLARNIVRCGCILTEYPIGTRPNKFNFPQRNRIISGLCSGVAVIEGREKSGAMITAKYAQMQGRRLYAFPGSVGAENSEAGNLLIKNGATLITRAEDVIKDYSDISKGPILNPFKLDEKIPVSMNSVLTELGVCALAPNDGIFKPVIKKQNKIYDINVPDLNTEAEKRFDKSSLERSALSEVEAAFNSDILEIYKKIPQDGDCQIESLADEKHTVRDVMKAMLKLEMGRFITMLPGERVKRNLK